MEENNNEVVAGPAGERASAPPPVSASTAERRPARTSRTPRQSGGRDRDERRPGRRPYARRRAKVCTFCANKAKTIDYKDVGLLRRFVTDRGKIQSQRKSGTCARHQRRLAIAVKRARHLALLPFSTERQRQGY